MVTLIPGDGIGPEISTAVQQIFAAAKVWYDNFSHNFVMLLQIPKPTLNPRFFPESIHLQNLGFLWFAAISSGFWGASVCIFTY